MAILMEFHGKRGGTVYANDDVLKTLTPEQIQANIDRFVEIGRKLLVEAEVRKMQEAQEQVSRNKQSRTFKRRDKPMKKALPVIFLLTFVAILALTGAAEQGTISLTAYVIYSAVDLVTMVITGRKAGIVKWN